MYKLNRIFEDLNMEIPDDSELKKIYGEEGYPHDRRMKWVHDFKQKNKSNEIEPEDNFEEELRRKRQSHLDTIGKENIERELGYAETENKFKEIENLKVDLSAKVVDILGNSLRKDDRTFVDELRSLLDKFSEYKTKIDPNAKSVNIDEPFMVYKFSDLPSTDSVYQKDPVRRKQ